MGLTLLGSEFLYVDISPSQPRYANATTRSSVFVINWVSTAAILLGIAALAVVTRRRLRRFGRGAARAPAAVPGAGALAPLQPRPVAAAGPLPAVVQEPLPPKESPHRLVLLWYRRIVSLVQRILQVAFAANETPREFLRKVAPHLGPARSFFSDLTLSAERTLYSGRHPSEAEAEDAVRISHEIEGKLRNPA